MTVGPRIATLRRFLAVSLLLALLLPALSLATPATAQQPGRGGTMVIALAGNPPNFNLGPNISFLLYQVAGNVYSFLIRYDKNMTWRPDLAESWTRSPDGLTYTFKLRKGAVWHDGAPFTSEDVKFTFEQIHAKYGGNTENWKAVKVEAPDGQTVVFKASKYDALLERIFGNFTSPIYPKHLWANDVGSADAMLKSQYAKTPVGTGPFKLKEYVPGSHIEMVRNDKYYDPALPNVDRLVYRILPDAQARLVALEKGEIDLMPRDVPLSEIERLRKVPNLKVDVDYTVSGKFYTIFVNTRKAPLNSRTVRQALSHAVNRDRIVQRALFNVASPGWNPLLSTRASHAGEIANPNLPKYEHSYDRARALLDQEGLKAGPDNTRAKLRLLVETSLPANVPMAELIVDDLKQVGIQADLQKVDTATAQDLVYQKWDFDLYLVRIVTFNSPVLQMNRRVTSPYIRQGVSLNAVGYGNQEVDALFEQAAAESDPKRRTDLLRQIQQIVATDLPMITLAEEPDPRAYSADLAGMPDAVQGDESFETVSRRSLSQAAPTTATQVSPQPAPSAAAGQSYAGPIVALVVVVAIGAGLFFGFRTRRR